MAQVPNSRSALQPTPMPPAAGPRPEVTIEWQPLQAHHFLSFVRNQWLTPGSHPVATDRGQDVQARVPVVEDLRKVARELGMLSNEPEDDAAQHLKTEMETDLLLFLRRLAIMAAAVDSLYVSESVYLNTKSRHEEHTCTFDATEDASGELTNQLRSILGRLHQSLLTLEEERAESAERQHTIPEEDATRHPRVHQFNAVRRSRPTIQELIRQFDDVTSLVGQRCAQQAMDIKVLHSRLSEHRKQADELNDKSQLIQLAEDRPMTGLDRPTVDETEEGKTGKIAREEERAQEAETGTEKHNCNAKANAQQKAFFDVPQPRQPIETQRAANNGPDTMVGDLEMCIRELEKEHAEHECFPCIQKSIAAIREVVSQQQWHGFLHEGDEFNAALRQEEILQGRPSKQHDDTDPAKSEWYAHTQILNQISELKKELCGRDVIIELQQDVEQSHQTAIRGLLQDKLDREARLRDLERKLESEDTKIIELRQLVKTKDAEIIECEESFQDAEDRVAQLQRTVANLEQKLDMHEKSVVATTEGKHRQDQPPHHQLSTHASRARASFGGRDKVQFRRLANMYTIVFGIMASIDQKLKEGSDTAAITGVLDQMTARVMNGRSGKHTSAPVTTKEVKEFWKDLREVDDWAEEWLRSQEKQESLLLNLKD